MIKITWTLFLFMHLSLLGVAAFADSNAILKLNPSKTIVAVLPIADQTAIKDDADKINQPVLAKLFTDSGFKIVDDNKVAKAIVNLKIDLNDKKQQTDDNLCKIGKVVGANIVVFDVITDKHEKGDDYFHTARFGYSTLKVWLVDVNNKQPLLDAKEVNGKERENIPIYLAR